jgi:phosphoserine phosphatase SerB
MIETYELIWISPILSQAETEGVFHWVNMHLTDARLKPLISFSKIKVEFLTEPKEALKLSFQVTSVGVEHSIELFKEAIWSEVLAKLHPAQTPYLVSLQPITTLHAHKKLVCFDMDSTLINEEVIDEIARTAGVYEKVSEITEAAMQGKLDFKTSLRERVKLFKGMPKAQAESIIQNLSVSPGAEKLLTNFRFRGTRTAVVSGGFEFILKHFQKQLFLDHVYGNHLITDDDENFTGMVDDPIVDAGYKRKLVSQMKENYHASAAETVVVGDGANDIPMMGVAGVSVSFCGKPKLAAHVNTLIFDRNLMWLNSIIGGQ